MPCRLNLMLENETHNECITRSGWKLLDFSHSQHWKQEQCFILKYETNWPVLSAQLMTAPTGKAREIRNFPPDEPPRPAEQEPQVNTCKHQLFKEYQPSISKSVLFLQQACFGTGPLQGRLPKKPQNFTQVKHSSQCPSAEVAATHSSVPQVGQP